MIKLSLSDNDLKGTLEAPDFYQVFDIYDLSLIIFLKTDTHFGTGLILIASVDKSNNDVILELAYKIQISLIEEVETQEPLILLQHLAQKFGLTIRIGQYLNKFIFRESIPLSQSTGTELVRILEHRPHMGTLFFKIVEDNGKRIGNCALAIFLDEEKYLSWLNDQSAESKTSILITPALEGKMTNYDLIASKGTMAFSVPNSDISANKAGFIFKLMARDYLLEAGFTQGSFYIRRNDDRLEFPIPIEPSNVTKAEYLITWSPEELKLCRLEDDWDKGLFTQEDRIMAVDKRTKQLRTMLFFPPNSLIEWARKQSIAPRVTYASDNEFYQSIINSLQTIQDKVDSLGANNPFWDISYDGSKIISRQPKKETDIHPTIHSLLFDIAIAKNFQVIREYPLAGGFLDFFVIGNLQNGKMTNVCIEFKHAHSKDVYDGLTKQLPAYMKAKGAERGLYCVMFFKGPHFDQPGEFATIHDAHMVLDKFMLEQGLKNIRIITFNFSYPISPSKL